MQQYPGNMPPQIAELLMKLQGLQLPPTVGQARQKELTPMQKERIKGDMAPDKPPMQIIGGQQDLLPPETDAAFNTAEELAPEPEVPAEGGMTVAEAIKLAGAGASATKDMMPRAPRAPSLPGGGRFANIDPTTLLFLRSMMSGRR